MATSSSTVAAGVSRLTPGVQTIQKSSPFFDVYPYLSAASHARPEIPEWSGPRGFGARHVHDPVPFTFWEDEVGNYRAPTAQEKRHLLDHFQAESLEFADWMLIVQTAVPPSPVPLTVGCMPAVFLPPGTKRKFILADAPYPNPDVPDPSPVKLRRLVHPTMDEIVAITGALQSVANIREVNFFPSSILVQLEVEDGRVYENWSLPYVVAGLPTTYHYDRTPFFAATKNHGRQQVFNPQSYLGLAELPQDRTNYLLQWRSLCPGVRVSEGVSENEVRSSSSGILLRKDNTLEFLTVANHRFPSSGEVYHPDETGDTIGHVVQRYPELNIAMVKLTPANSNKFTNRIYFNADAPQKLMETNALRWGTFHKVDSMSAGLVPFLYMGHKMVKPIRPPGHPEVPVVQWENFRMFEAFGGISPAVQEGMCGAPFVESGTGNVSGFFHLANGDYTECPAIDYLVEEGYEVV